MKKIITNIMILCMCMTAALSACAELPPTPDTEDKAPLHKIENAVLPRLSVGESLRMQSYMSGGRALILGQRLYCMDFDQNQNPALCSYDITSSKPSDFKILLSDCIPEFICSYSDRIYFINKNSGGNIESVNLEGGDRQTVKEGPCDFLSIHGDKMYYCDSSMVFCASSLLGVGEEIVITEPCFYPYIIGDKLIYQLFRNEHLYLKNLSTGIETELTDLPAYAPVLVGDRLYCTVEGGVLSMDTDGFNPIKYEIGKIQGIAEFSVRQGKIYVRGVSGGKEIREWNFETENPKESFEYKITGSYSLCEYIDENYAVFSNYEPGGRIKSFTITDQNGRESQFYSGKILA